MNAVLLIVLFAQDGGVDSGTPDAAAVRSVKVELAISRQVEIRCATFLNGLRYHEARRDQQQTPALRQSEEQMAASFRQLAKGCAYSVRTEMEKSNADDPEREVRSRDAAQRHETAVALQRGRRSNAGWMKPLLSAKICRATRERRATTAEITKEKKLAREAGVVDLERMREYQNTLRDDDEEVADARQQAASLKLKTGSCSEPTIAAITDCLDVYTPRLPEETLQDVCKNPAVLPYVRLLKDEQDL